MLYLVKASLISSEHSLSNMCIFGACPLSCNILNNFFQADVISPALLVLSGSHNIAFVS